MVPSLIIVALLLLQGCGSNQNSTIQSGPSDSSSTTNQGSQKKSKSPFSNEQLLAKGLALTNSDVQSLHALGWAAIRYSETQNLTPSISQPEVSDALRSIELKASVENTKDAIATLVSTYKSNQTRRIQILREQGRGIQFETALLAQLASPQPGAEQTEEQNILKRVYAGLVNPTQNRIGERSFKERCLSALALQIVLESPSLRSDALFRNLPTQAEIEKELITCTNAPASPPADPFELVLAEECLKTLRPKHSGVSKNSNAENIGSASNAVVSAVSEFMPEDQDTVFTATGSIRATGNGVTRTVGPGVFNITPQSSEVFDLGAWITSAGAAYINGTLRPASPPSSWRCLSGTHYYLVGLCGLSFSEKKPAATNAPYIQSSNVGLTRRAWIGRVGASSWSSTTLHFELRAKYAPAHDTTWLAVRWIGSASGESPKCLRGCTKLESDISEPGTGFTIFEILPNTNQITLLETSSLSFQVTGSPTPPLVSDIKEGFEIVEFGPSNIRESNSSEVRNLGIDLGDNPILSYLARLESSFGSGGWLAPASIRPEIDTASALASLRVLNELAQAAPETTISSEVYARSAWRDRQRILLQSKTTLAKRTLKHYSPQLLPELYTLSDTLETLNELSSQIDTAIGSVSELSEERSLALIERVSQPLNLIEKDIETLHTAVFGARALLDEKIQQFETRRALGCASAKRLMELAETEDSALSNALTHNCKSREQ